MMRMRRDGWYRIVSSYFVAGLRVEGGKVVTAAPIIGWMVGKPVRSIRAWLLVKRCIVEKIGSGKIDFSLGSSGAD